MFALLLSAFQDQPATHPSHRLRQAAESCDLRLPFLPTTYVAPRWETTFSCETGLHPVDARPQRPALQAPRATSPAVTPHRNHRILAAASGAGKRGIFFFLVNNQTPTILRTAAVKLLKSLQLVKIIYT